MKGPDLLRKALSGTHIEKLEKDRLDEEWIKRTLK